MSERAKNFLLRVRQASHRPFPRRDRVTRIVRGCVGPIEGRWTMTRTDLTAIRRRLRDVNIEYSGLVRNKLGESRFVRMEELKAERETLVGLIVQNEKSRLPAVGAVLCPGSSPLHAAH